MEEKIEEQELSLIELAREVVRDIWQRQVSKAYMSVNTDEDKALQAAFMADILLCVKRQRLTAIHDATVADAIWNVIREKEQVADLILDGTSELVLRCKGGSAGFSKLTEAIAVSFSAHTVKSSAIDDALLSRMPNKGILQPILVANPWLVFLIIFNTVL